MCVTRRSSLSVAESGNESYDSNQYRVCTIIVRDRYGLMVKWFCKAYGDVLGCAISLGRFFVTLMVMQSHLRRDGSLR